MTSGPLVSPRPNGAEDKVCWCHSCTITGPLTSWAFIKCGFGKHLFSSHGVSAIMLGKGEGNMHMRDWHRALFRAQQRHACSRAAVLRDVGAVKSCLSPQRIMYGLCCLPWGDSGGISGGISSVSSQKSTEQMCVSAVLWEARASGQHSVNRSTEALTFPSSRHNF